MKIAFTTTGADLDAPVSDRFGRAPKFVIYDTESNSFETVDNSVSLDAPQGAGIQTAQNIVRHGVSCVITGHCGPKAFSVLNRANIRVFLVHGKTIRESLDAFGKGQLKEARAADVEGHW